MTPVWIAFATGLFLGGAAVLIIIGLIRAGIQPDFEFDDEISYRILNKRREGGKN